MIVRPLIAPDTTDQVQVTIVLFARVFRRHGQAFVAINIPITPTLMTIYRMFIVGRHHSRHSTDRARVSRLHKDLLDLRAVSYAG